MVSSVIANTARDPKKRSDPFRASDFLPDWSEDRSEEIEEQPLEEQLATVRSIFSRRRKEKPSPP